MFTELDDSAANYNKLTVAASGAWHSQVGADTASTVATEFERMTGDSRFAEVINNPNSTDAG